jgi:hypothetical protein
VRAGAGSTPTSSEPSSPTFATPGDMVGGSGAQQPADTAVAAVRLSVHSTGADASGATNCAATMTPGAASTPTSNAEGACAVSSGTGRRETDSSMLHSTCDSPQRGTGSDSVENSPASGTCAAAVVATTCTASKSRKHTRRRRRQELEAPAAAAEPPGTANPARDQPVHVIRHGAALLAHEAGTNKGSSGCRSTPSVAVASSTPSEARAITAGTPCEPAAPDAGEQRASIISAAVKSAVHTHQAASPDSHRPEPATEQVQKKLTVEHVPSAMQGCSIQGNADPRQPVRSDASPAPAVVASDDAGSRQSERLMAAAAMVHNVRLECDHTSFASQLTLAGSDTVASAADTAREGQSSSGHGAQSADDGDVSKSAGSPADDLGGPGNPHGGSCPDDQSATATDSGSSALLAPAALFGAIGSRVNVAEAEPDVSPCATQAPSLFEWHGHVEVEQHAGTRKMDRSGHLDVGWTQLDPGPAHQPGDAAVVASGHVAANAQAVDMLASDADGCAPTRSTQAALNYNVKPPREHELQPTARGEAGPATAPHKAPPQNAAQDMSPALTLPAETLIQLARAHLQLQLTSAHVSPAIAHAASVAATPRLQLHAQQRPQPPMCASYSQTVPTHNGGHKSACAQDRGDAALRVAIAQACTAAVVPDACAARAGAPREAYDHGARVVRIDLSATAQASASCTRYARSQALGAEQAGYASMQRAHRW